MEKQDKKIFNVEVKKISDKQAVVQAHGQKLIFSIKGNDPALGLTAPETVLGAFGLCIISNITKEAAEMGLRVGGVVIEFEALKRTTPLGFEDLHYSVTIQSDESAEKLRELFERATTNGTATNALLEGLKPNGELHIKVNENDI